MFVLDTMGTSSPEMVPAVKTKCPFLEQSHLAFNKKKKKETLHIEMKVLWLQRVIINALTSLFVHFEQQESTHVQLSLFLNWI